MVTVPSSNELPPRSPRLRRRDPRPPGLSPGERIHVGEQRVSEVTFRVMDYSAGEFRELRAETAGQCVDFEGRDSPTWIMVTGLHDVDRIGSLLEAYGVHPLVQDDIVNTNQPPKVEDFGSYLYVAARQLTLTPDDCEDDFDVQHFSAILTDRVLLTFHEAPSPVFAPVLKRLREGKGRLRSQGPDYLLWALLDALLDHYLVALDALEEEVAEMDEELTLPGADIDLGEIHAIRARTNFLYRIVRPMREVATALQHSDSELLTRSITPFLRDFYDHAWHAIETADHLRESVTSIREFHHAVLSQRMNEVMKVLTAISTVFLPLTFVAGVYGMNFDYQPELHWRWGYGLVWGLFVVITLLLLWYFRRRKWL